MNENYWGVKNNTSLPELNESSLVRNLKERYQRAYSSKAHSGEDEGGSGIYTWTGTVLLAVNPYQRLNVYGDSQIEHHFSKTITQADPHPFGIASHAFQTLNKTKSAQSIVVSGESGAGKTETAKFVMRFLSTIGRSSSGDTLASFLESTNPILEAYGNAKTCRNENSSRFGKVMKLFYTPSGMAGHKLVSAAVETYLLARSRVTHTPQNERNYHVFYLLTNGGLESHFPELKSIVRPASFFSYLAGSAQVQSGYLTDSDFLKEMLTAFSSLGVPKEDQTKLFELVLALLWLGNINIEAADEGGQCKVSGSSQEAVEVVSRIMQIPLGGENVSLEKLLTELKLSIGTNNKNNSSIWAGTSASKARTVRDAVVRRVYSKMFDYVVSLLNVKLASYVSGSNSQVSLDESRFISILDIFGFENLPTNGLEQLCINYANERLQNFFLKNVVISEAEEYSRECVPYPGVNPPDNGPVIRAVAGRNGIFELLRKTTVDSMLRPLEGRDYDSDFYAILSSGTSSSGGIVKATTSGGKGKNNPLVNTFVVAHYAEPVQYQVEGFVDSNKDSDARVDFILSHFHNPLLQECLLVPVPGGNLGGAGEGGSSSQQQRRCIATTFSAQVDHLLEDHLEKTRLHCIRCLKPNDVKKPNFFEDSRVAGQLRVSGMFEVLTLMAHSYPVRIPYQDLFNRYKPLLSEKILQELTKQCGGPGAGSKVHGAMARLFVQETVGLLAHGDGGLGLIAANPDLLEGKDFQCGTSKVFFRLGKVEPLEKLLALCDADKAFAKQIADLIGKRIMEKRKSRQLKYMRTCFKLLIIYRRRQNYWKWFHAYFTRLTFLVKACKQHFIPLIKLRRIRKNICARTIQQAFRTHLETRRSEARDLVQSAMLSYCLRGRLASQSKLRFQMTISSEKIHALVVGFSAKASLVTLREDVARKRREEEMERLRVEAENQARIAAERELELQRIAEMERVAAAEALEQTRLENERRLGAASERISQLESECVEKMGEIDALRAQKELELETARQSLQKMEESAKEQVDSISANLEEKLAELEAVRSSFESEISGLKVEHAESISALGSKQEELSNQLSVLKDELREKSLEVIRLTESNSAEIDRLTQEHCTELDRVRIQMRESEDCLRSEIETIQAELASRSELYDYSKQQAEEEREMLNRAHAEEVRNAASALEETERDLNVKISQLMDQVDSGSKLLERTKLNDQEIIDRLMAQHESDLAGAREDMAKLRYETDSRMEQISLELQQAREVMSEKESEWEHAKQEHADDVMFARIKAKESEDGLQLRISELSVSLESSQVKFEEISKKHVEDLETMRSLHANEVDQLRSDLEKLGENHKLVISQKQAEFESALKDQETSLSEKLVKLVETQNMLNAESAALLEEKETEIDSLKSKHQELERTHLKEVANLRSQLEDQSKISKADLVSLEQERTKLVAAEAEKRLLLDRLIVGLRNELKSQQAEFDQAMAGKEKELKEALLGEKNRLESLLAISKGETAALTEQLELVVQEKAKLAVVASQSLMQGEKLKKDAEELVKRERAEMERKIVSETSKMKRDFETYNQQTLEVKIREIEQLKSDTQTRLGEAEKMRSDALSIMQEIRRGAEDSGEKTIAVLPLEKEEVIQQAIRDYHSASDDYERTYVIERRKDTTKKERQIDSAKTNALEVKLQHTSVGKKSVGGRKSLGNVTNVALMRSPEKKELQEQQPAAKIPRLVNN